ncbi:hypothetical protein JTB14_008887 [Gonioctena quinquepunctata]|nr:hypothetical protein JTB14_008887 [Gonioctena quinquepunctata]
MGECRNTDEVNMTLCTYCGIFSPNLEEHVSSIHGSDHSEYSVLENGQKNSKYSTKQHFCVFCKTLQTKLARHLERKHPQEPPVQKAVYCKVSF